MSTPPNAHPVDYFSTIATELRLEIYKHLFIKTDLTSADAPMQKNFLAILRVSRQIHAEAAGEFYKRNEFLFTRGSNTPMAPIAPTYHQFLSKIALSICTGHPNNPAMLTKAALIRGPVFANLPKLDQVSIDIRSSLHRLTVHYFDDSLLDRMHPITQALCGLIRSGAAKHIRIRLSSARFAPGITAILSGVFDSANHPEATLEFFRGASFDATHRVVDLTTIERAPKGVYNSDPMSLGDFDDADLTYGALGLLRSDAVEEGYYASSIASSEEEEADLEGVAEEEEDEHVEMEDADGCLIAAMVSFVPGLL
jgi:hypothetical protein